MWNCLSSAADGVEHARSSASLTSSRAPQPANDPSCQSCRWQISTNQATALYTHTHTHRTLGFHDQTNGIDSSADVWNISFKSLLPTFVMQHTAGSTVVSSEKGQNVNMDREMLKNLFSSRRPTRVLHFLSLVDTWSFALNYKRPLPWKQDSRSLLSTSICHTAISVAEEEENKEEEPSGLFSKSRSSLVLQEWRGSLRLPIQTASLLNQWKQNSSAPQPQTITCFCFSVARIFRSKITHLRILCCWFFLLSSISISYESQAGKCSILQHLRWSVFYKRTVAACCYSRELVPAGLIT